MIRRAPIETKINHERWLVSYSDFITLLFGFFVVMYSVSQVEETKYKELSETLSQAFEGMKTTQESDIRDPGSASTNLADLNEMKKMLEGSLQGLVQHSQVEFSGNEDWVDIALDANLIFTSAKSELSGEAKKVFTQIADLLAPFDNAIEVSGHTDNIPIRNSDFSNNWELSAARAVSVVNWLAYHGVAPDRLAAVGYGEYKPLADNSTESGRAANRRVVLRVARQRAEPVSPQYQSQASEVDEAIILEQDTLEEPEKEDAIKPIELDNGGLLFTRDSDSPRNQQSQRQ